MNDRPAPNMPMNAKKPAPSVASATPARKRAAAPVKPAASPVKPTAAPAVQKTAARRAAPARAATGSASARASAAPASAATASAAARPVPRPAAAPASTPASAPVSTSAPGAGSKPATEGPGAAGRPAKAGAQAFHAAPAAQAQAYYRQIDQQAHALLSKLLGAQSPTLAAQAYGDWLAHLAASPGKQMALMQLAAQQAQQLAAYAVSGACQGAAGQGAAAPAAASGTAPAAKSGTSLSAWPNPWALPASLCAPFAKAATALAAAQGAEGANPAAPPVQDRRFKAPEWQQWPFNLLSQSYLLAEQWWHAAASGVRGVDQHHADWVRFSLQHLIDAASPANNFLTNPVVQARTREQGGANLLRGAQQLVDDTLRQMRQQPPAGSTDYAVGQDVACTPGQVVLRTPLMELIQYTPSTDKVLPEPLLIVPAWIMKYYVLDLSPHNSLIQYLVNQGHTVFCISWKNPGVAERDCTMDDYLQQGLMAALEAIASIIPRQPIHAAGYCLGGTLLAIGAAALARDAAAAGDATGKGRNSSPLASITLLAAQTDFSEPGGLGLYIDDNQLNLLEAQMAETGYLSGPQMGVAFQWLHAYDLLWSQLVGHYLLGESTQTSDLMAWNADTTRMPARMHADYLRQMFRHNDLSSGRYSTAAPLTAPTDAAKEIATTPENTSRSPVFLMDIRLPTFMVGTESDHVAPWRSVYKLHLFSPAEITFVLTNGGHNAGIVSEPGHPRRHYRQHTRPALGRTLGAEPWLQAATAHEGSWWPAWHQWLAARSGKPVAAPAQVGNRSYPALAPAPGRYVLER